MTKERNHVVHDGNCARVCPICGSANSRMVRTIEGSYLGIDNDHTIIEHISICNDCGFIFAAPTLAEDEFNSYYNDTLPTFEAHESYSVPKRLKVLSDYIDDTKLIAEIGGNAQGEFKEALMSRCRKYYSFDVNQTANNNSDEEDIPVVDVLCCYFVMEHIVNINEFIDKWSEHLKDDGIFVVEVPDLNVYYRETNPLCLTEHVNHFTPESLSLLMLKHGYETVGFSRFDCSRTFGFVSVFRKTGARSENPAADRLKLAAVLDGFRLTDGLAAVDEQMLKLNEFAERVDSQMKQPGRKVLLWCANDMMREFLDAYEKRFGTFSGLIIDEDKRKADYYRSYKAHTSADAENAKMLEGITDIYIFSDIRLRVESVCRTIKERKLQKADICYISQRWDIIKTDTD
ncbi:MAG: class I SAM-dependent methyltransferase [Lachnospiraceae bacterium]|nr:class I SAM-dependent methyltransferase [Lachnospiraceae bacterium]